MIASLFLGHGAGKQPVPAALASQEWERLCYGIYVGGCEVLCRMEW